MMKTNVLKMMTNVLAAMGRNEMLAMGYKL